MLLLSLLLAPLTQAAHLAPSTHNITAQLAVLSPYRRQIIHRLGVNKRLIRDILQQLQQHKLPESLILLPMLESSFDPRAVSRAHAAGLWQLMPATAKRYGLQVTQQRDERFDVTPSTQAALRYLTFLYKKFAGNLPLTLAAYNAGEGKISRAIEAANSRDFTRLQLPPETRRYVWRFYALQKMVDMHELKKSLRTSLSLFSQLGMSRSSPLIDLAPLPPLIDL